MYKIAKDRFGKWSLIFLVDFFLWLAVFYLFTELGQTGGQGFFSNPLLAIPALFVGITGIAAFFIGGISIIKYKHLNKSEII